MHIKCSMKCYNESLLLCRVSLIDLVYIHDVVSFIFELTLLISVVIL